MSQVIDEEDLFNAIICYEDESVLVAAEVLKDSQRKHLIIVNSEVKPVGVLSSFDIVEKVIVDQKDPQEVLIQEIMNPNIVVLGFGDSHEHAISTMVELGTYSLPIVDSEGVLKGMVCLDVLLYKEGLIKEED